MAPYHFIARPARGLAIAERQEPTVYCVHLSRRCSPLPAPMVTRSGIVKTCSRCRCDVARLNQGLPAEEFVELTPEPAEASVHSAAACYTDSALDKAVGISWPRAVNTRVAYKTAAMSVDTNPKRKRGTLA